MFRQQSEPRGGVATEEPVGDESCDQEVVNKMYRAMAQLVARLHGVQEVGGSSPPSPTIQEIPTFEEVAKLFHI